MFVHAATVAAVALLLANPLQAQTAGLTLSGTVMGASAPVPNATVMVTNVATRQSMQTQTGADGRYSVPNLTPGNYEISVSATGFQAHMLAVTLGASAGQVVDVTLSAAPAQGGLSLQDLGISAAEAAGNAQEQATLDRRSQMLKIHQRLGLVTAATMLASILTSGGAKIGRRETTTNPTGRDIHATLGTINTGMYATTAYFAIRAPKIPGTETRGHIRLHKALAWIHGSGMVLTPALGAIADHQERQGQRVHGLASFHSQMAVATFAAYVGAMLSVSIK
jgi:hypothetical protein